MTTKSNAPHPYSSGPAPAAGRFVVPWLVFLGAWGLYGLTTAPGTLFGDPSEYQFIPAIWGIAHPPGYAFYTLVAGLWQRVVAVGSVAYRTNLLAGAMGAWAVSRVYVISRMLLVDHAAAERGEGRALFASLAATGAAFAVAVAPDVWQHSIHANAHMMSAAITVTQLWLLVRWYQHRRTGWLFALAFLVGMGVTHHPMTIWGIPAYVIFILLCRPRIITEVKTILGGVVAGLAGLWPWLYFPLRSPSTPFGPTDMATWEGFLRHATAQGLRVNLFHFGLADQPDRWVVFFNLLRLQYGWVLIALMGLGLVALAVERSRIAVLWALFVAGHLLFTLNTVQDVMAYLLHVFIPLGLPLAMGIKAVARALRRATRWRVQLAAFVLAGLLVGRTVTTWPRISLTGWRDADGYTMALDQRFRDGGTGAAFVSDWEHLTPYFYHTYVEGLTVDGADLRPVYVTGASPWTASVFDNLPAGPVYLSGYRREIRELGFRLRPVGELWQVLEPPAMAPVSPQIPLHDVWVDGRLELLGYDLPLAPVAPGAVVPLTLYARAPVTPSAILMPYVALGELEQAWTTDSRRLTPDWRPGEIIAERYELFVPYSLPPGRYAIRLGYRDLSAAGTPLPLPITVDSVTMGGGAALQLGELAVEPEAGASRTARRVARSLVNIGNDVALAGVRARAGLEMRRGPWERALSLKPGQPLHLTLTWDVLSRPRTSYTVFIHLIDAQGQLWFGHDYTPLGGAFPSYLWFPKWLEGQWVHDPYRLVMPDTLPAGTYWLEVGMYEMGSIRRMPHLNRLGDMVGDRYIVGPVTVIP